VDDPDPDEKPKSRTAYRWCVTLGITGTLIGVCSGLVVFASIPIRDAAARMTTSGQMKQLSLSVHNYHDSMDVMPGPFLDGDLADHTIPADPARRLSWRVSVLPYIEAHDLYRRLNRSEAWDGPTNRPLTSTHYKPLSDTLDGKTSLSPYRVFFDNGALWDSDPARRLRLDKIPDGSANTILIAESTIQVPWAQFNEHAYTPDGPLPPLGRPSRNVFLVAMADGSVRAVKKSVDPSILRAAVTRDGGEPPPFGD
jgi:hypothetical protein